MKTEVRVLLVEDDTAYARLVEILLTEDPDSACRVERATRLDEALDRLPEGFDVALVDLSLPDSSGLETFDRVHEAAPDLPVVVLTGLDDEDLALEAMRRGAQDYLVKGRAENAVLRALRYAVERNRMQAEIRQQALVDELTGLRNRRGFVTVAEQQLKLAGRKGTIAAVAFIDLDGMKLINDSLGHAEGDRALVDTAAILTGSLRASDIVARLGGDEFCVLFPDCSEADLDAILRRLRERLAAHNATAGRPYELSLSVGSAFFDPESPRSIEQLLENADRSMYRGKLGRSGRPQARSVATSNPSDEPGPGRDLSA